MADTTPGLEPPAEVIAAARLIGDWGRGERLRDYVIHGIGPGNLLRAELEAAQKRIEVLELVTELAYVPHRSLVESRDRERALREASEAREKELADQISRETGIILQLREDLRAARRRSGGTRVIGRRFLERGTSADLSLDVLVARENAGAFELIVRLPEYP